MKDIHNFARLLISSWVLSGEKHQITSSHGVLDRALQASFKRGAIPSIGPKLHFVESRVGLKCVELETILKWAQSAELTTAPNPSYQYTEVKISDHVARRLLARLGIGASIAQKWGAVLREEVERAEKVLARSEDRPQNEPAAAP